MRGPTRIALGFSFVLHSGLAISTYLLAPALSTHAGTNEATVNTRTGPPRNAHLSLWDETKKTPDKPTAKIVDEPAVLQQPVPAPAISRPAEQIPAPPLKSVATVPTPKSDHAALAGGPARSNSLESSGSSSAGNGGSRGTGGLGFFGISPEVRSIVFVIDGSSSMGQEGSFDAAKRELVASIQALKPVTKFQVIVYNKSAAPLRINGHVDLVPATPANKQAAFALIRELDPEGATDHVRAMQQALILRPEAIIFVTDADGLRADQVHALTVFNHGRSTIHTIELNATRRREQSPLQILAEQNRGDFRIARSIEK